MNARRPTVAKQEKWAPNYAVECEKLIHVWRRRFIRKNDFETIEFPSPLDTYQIGVPLLHFFLYKAKEKIRVDSAFYLVFLFKAARDCEIVVISFEVKSDLIAEQVLSLVHNTVDNLNELRRKCFC